MSESNVAALYEGKERGYFTAARLDLLGMLPPGGGLRLLEIGAGDGATLRAAKALGLASYGVGVDLIEPAPAPPGTPDVDRFLSGNFEAMKLDLPLEHFDAVLCADVLEHLVDPWKAVATLARHLRPGGLFLSSIRTSATTAPCAPSRSRGTSATPTRGCSTARTCASSAARTSARCSRGPGWWWRPWRPTWAVTGCATRPWTS